MDSLIVLKKWKINRIGLDKLAFVKADKSILWAILSIIFSQIIQKISPIVDNHYISLLGPQGLLIHNIQYSFISLGQYIGSATAISCLIFWRRSEYAKSQGIIFISHMVLALISASGIAIISIYFGDKILSHFSINPVYHSLAVRYFYIGLCNMMLQALFVTLIGVLVALGREKISLLFSILLLAVSLIADKFSIEVFFTGNSSPEGIAPAMISIILATSGFLIASNVYMTFLIFKSAAGWIVSDMREIIKIWMHELSGAFISGVYPIVYIFQLAVIKSSQSLLITYQLLLQVALVLCIPLLATIQITLRDSAKAIFPDNKNVRYSHWITQLIYFGLTPTVILLSVFALVPQFSLKLIYGYTIPADHFSFVMLFIIASLIGQFGNALTVPLRARKQSHLVNFSYFVSDVIVMLGGMQLIILFKFASPLMTGIVTLTYAVIYFLLNLYFVLRK